jgi:hypothetical protein
VTDDKQLVWEFHSPTSPATRGSSSRPCSTSCAWNRASRSIGCPMRPSPPLRTARRLPECLRSASRRDHVRPGFPKPSRFRAGSR